MMTSKGMTRLMAEIVLCSGLILRTANSAIFDEGWKAKTLDVLLLFGACLILDSLLNVFKRNVK